MQNITETVLREIERLLEERRFVLVAIDGNCAAGKTTLAATLQTICGCNVVPMDHFFLRAKQRTQERLSEPGGNVDCERFAKEVMSPLKQKRPFTYRPFDCRAQAMAEEIRIDPRPVNIIEGSYSCHPALFENYDLRIFMAVSAAAQLQRIRQRNGAGAVQFQEKWIPLEERYFSAYKIRERCDLCFTTD